MKKKTCNIYRKIIEDNKIIHRCNHNKEADINYLKLKNIFLKISKSLSHTTIIIRNHCNLAQCIQKIHTNKLFFEIRKNLRDEEFREKK